MGNGWHEWPLVLFTVLGQCVVGGLIVSGIVWMNANDDRSGQVRIVRSQFLLWVLMGIGFIASMMHLGSPLRAFNSLNRVGASALSNEIAAGSLFFAVGGFWWLVSWLGKMPAALSRIWLAISMLLGVLFVWTMTQVYQIDTVPTWHNGYTTAAFFLTMLVCGPLLAALLLRLAGIRFRASRFAALSVAAFIASIAVVMLQSQQLGEIHSSIQQAVALIPYYATLQVARLLLVALGLGCWICPLVMRKQPRVLSLLPGIVLVTAGEVIGRGLFYGLHMTGGVAVSG
ncbi:dimethyl sulfoxide reductase anchor subunit family protein [Kosakonia oryziphila]|uniref:Tat-targeted selenate reductase subunit YnfH n=1 Tax=Kosakonia oryziphila TaxID=1005667 RepID=A0A1C4F7J3_9ENTR|nr:dimethyl sulfoxide reductase anchor subunit family protein [Kosakonia oryziphila]SCC51471.1 Tat-targeted selenate reductase subunit YnfH [Kosakonia oryziphila]